MSERIPLSSATIGVVTALPLEFAAACHVLDCFQKEEVEGRKYRVGTIKRQGYPGVHTVAVLCLNDMGNSAAASGTRALLQDCKSVQYVIMCGIAGGVPNPSKADDDVRLGDVVVPDARGVTQYDHESVRERDIKINARNRSVSSALLGAARELAGDANLGARPWVQYVEDAVTELERRDRHVGGRWRRPPANTDVLREFSPERKLDSLIKFARYCRVPAKRIPYRPIARPVDPTRAPDLPKIFFGPIASASKLQRNTKTRNILNQLYGAMAVDMESGGVGEAAWDETVGFIAIRAVADYCNEYKNEHWQAYAAVVAAAYTRALIEVTQPRLSASRGGPATTSTAIATAQNINTDLEETLENALREQGQRTLDSLKQYLETWEFRDALALADGQEAWIEKHRKYLPDDLITALYIMLARVEFARVGQGRESGSIVDVDQAQHYLAKARNGRQL